MSGDYLVENSGREKESGNSRATGYCRNHGKDSGATGLPDVAGSTDSHIFACRVVADVKNLLLKFSFLYSVFSFRVSYGQTL